jgi:hypothetical protein
MLNSKILLALALLAPSAFAGGIQSGFPVISRSGNTTGYANFTGSLTGTGNPCLDGSGNLTVTGCSGGSGLSVVLPYLFDGSVYYTGSPLRAVTLPDLTTFTWVNQLTATIAADGHALVLHDPGNNFSQKLRIHAIGGGKTTVTAAVTLTELPVNFNECGVGLYESGTQKFEGLAVTSQNSNGISIQGRRWTNPTTFSSAISNAGQVSQQNGFGLPSLVWFQAIYDGTNVVLNYSSDGLNFSQLLTESKTAWFTTAPDTFAFYCAAGNAVYDAWLELTSWKEQ